MSMLQAGFINGNFEGIFEKTPKYLPPGLSDSETWEINNGVSNSMIVRYYMIEF